MNIILLLWERAIYFWATTKDLEEYIFFVHNFETMALCKTPFHTSHIKLYGVRIAGCCPSSGQVKTVQCLFCLNFGRKEKSGMKRKPSSSIHFYLSPFCYDSYLRHLQSQHSLWYEEYCKMTPEEKGNYFSIESVKCLAKHFQLETPKVYAVNAEIVNRLISNLFLVLDGKTDIEV